VDILKKLLPKPQIVIDKETNLKVVTIGKQEWLAENLNVNIFRNGDIIPEAKIWEEWEKAGKKRKPIWCYYRNDPANSEYGYLYNWYAVNDSRGLAPESWRVPTDSDWKDLEIYLGMSLDQVDIENAYRGIDEGGKLKETGTIHWLKPNTGASNKSSFSALAGGWCAENGAWDDMGFGAYFWSSTEDTRYPGRAWSRRLDYNNSKIGRSSYIKEAGYSVRCVRS